MDELVQLKVKAKNLYERANAFGDLSCGRNMAETLRPDIAIARREFSETWKRIRELDPSAPPDPFEKGKL